MLSLEMQNKILFFLVENVLKRAQKNFRGGHFWGERVGRGRRTAYRFGKKIL